LVGDGGWIFSNDRLPKVEVKEFILRVRCWPKAASELGIFSVGFGEISWFWEEKFSTLGFDIRNQE
jgi:hypothetical protein